MMIIMLGTTPSRTHGPQGQGGMMKCKNKIELCPHCEEREIEIDDFGWSGCQRCFDEAAPGLKTYMSKRQDEEDVLFGYEN